MLNDSNTSEVSAVALSAVDAKPAKQAKPDPIADVRAEVEHAANDAASFAANEAGFKDKATTAHAHAAWLYMVHVTCETDAEKHKAKAAAFGAAFKAAYQTTRGASDDATKKALSRVKATATRAYDADCTGPEDVAKLGTQTSADKAADKARKDGKRGGAVPAGLAKPARDAVRDNVGDHDATYAALKAFFEIFDAGEFKPRVGGDVGRVKSLRGVLISQLRKYEAAQA